MAKVTDAGGRPHSGIVQQPVIGVVTDNRDPLGWGRVKVKFPTLHGEPPSDWIPQVAPNAGKERGFYALPEIDDEVLVVFLQGSQEAAVVLGQLWNGEDIAPKEAKDAHPAPGKTDTGATWSTDQFTAGSPNFEKNDRRFWKSRSGHLIVFDDTEAAESIQIWDKDHTLSLVFETKEQRIILANTQGDLHIRTKKDLYLEAGQDIKWRAGRDIVGESARDTTHEAKRNWSSKSTQESKLEAGTNFTIDAGQNLTCKASMSTSVEGSVSYSAKGGSTAKLEGGAMTEVKGGIVKIN
ncbi:MAG: phage baseplate assembly protein V [Myxococcota bacterium]